MNVRAPTGQLLSGEVLPIAPERRGTPMADAIPLVAPSGRVAFGGTLRATALSLDYVGYMAQRQLERTTLSMFIVSGGSGATGQLLAETLLAQFPDCEVQLRCFKDCCATEELDRILERARELDAIVVHSLVDPNLRTYLMTRAETHALVSHDLFGELLTLLEQRLGRPPLAAPGRYRTLRREYFDRIEAIEFAVDHDDSQNLASIGCSDIVLVGVSRTGKTPLSMYLAMKGWRVANVSFLPEIGWHEELDHVDRGRIVGLSIELDRLLTHRKQRSAEVGLGRATPYSSEESLFLELEALREALKRHRVPIVDVTDKPLETSAHEVVELVTRQCGANVRRR